MHIMMDQYRYYQPFICRNNHSRGISSSDMISSNGFSGNDAFYWQQHSPKYQSGMPSVKIPYGQLRFRRSEPWYRQNTTIHVSWCIIGLVSGAPISNKDTKYDLTWWKWLPIQVIRRMHLSKNSINLLFWSHFICLETDDLHVPKQQR